MARFAGGDEAAAVQALAAAAPAPDPARAPTAIGSLPAVVSAAGLPVSAEESHNRVALRFALGDLGLAPVGFALHDGEHALVLGPPGSGRTSALAAIGASGRRPDGGGGGRADRPVPPLGGGGCRCRPPIWSGSARSAECCW